MAFFISSFLGLPPFIAISEREKREQRIMKCSLNMLVFLLKIVVCIVITGHMRKLGTRGLELGSSTQ